MQEIFDTLCQCAALNPDATDGGKTWMSVLLGWSCYACRSVVSASLDLRAAFSKCIMFVDDSEDGDFYYNEEEVLNGVGADTRAALLDRYDAMLDDSEQPELEEVFSFQLHICVSAKQVVCGKQAAFMCCSMYSHVVRLLHAASAMWAS